MEPRPETHRRCTAHAGAAQLLSVVSIHANGWSCGVPATRGKHQVLLPPRSASHDQRPQMRVWHRDARCRRRQVHGQPVCLQQCIFCNENPMRCGALRGHSGPEEQSDGVHGAAPPPAQEPRPEGSTAPASRARQTASPRGLPLPGRSSVRTLRNPTGSFLSHRGPRSSRL